MNESDPKADLRRYLQIAREAVLWKLDGLSEYDARRPMTPTGTNLLGLVKHLANVEIGYLGDTFGRPFEGPLPWSEGAEVLGPDGEPDPNADLWATPDESRAQIVDLYRAVWTHADVTIETLDVEAVGRVPWWPTERAEVTLHKILVHVIAETNRHAGHADIVRELIDGTAGLRADNSNLPSNDQAWWEDYRNRLEQAARDAESAGSR
jgi:hypothetical protein